MTLFQWSFNFVAVVSICLFASADSVVADTFSIATYNVENYLDQPTQTRKFVKSTAAKTKIQESILAMKPDVIAFEEMGALSALLELRESLKTAGLDYPYYEHISGWDTNIHVAVLSKFPFADRRPHTNDTFVIGDRRFSVSRGFAELDIQVSTNYSFTLLAAHLKSKVPRPEADESELRLEEARMLREHIETRLKAHPDANIVVVGDFNDGFNTPSTKAVVGKGKFKLVDTRPAERACDGSVSTNAAALRHKVAWTYHYSAEDTYTRIDYILLSPGMAKEWIANQTYVLTISDWGIGSDHRPVVATFEAANK
jgi:endonuclease/exonuclease/phosphatase family metal-dependent hydrolase